MVYYISVVSTEPREEGKSYRGHKFILSLKPMFLTNDRIKSRKDNYLAPNQIVDSSFFLNHNSTFIVFPFRKV